MGLVVRFSCVLLWIVSPGWSKGRRNAMEEDVGRVWGEFWHGEGSTSCRGLTAASSSHPQPQNKQPALAELLCLHGHLCSASGALLPARWRLLTCRVTGTQVPPTRCRSATRMATSSWRRISTSQPTATTARTFYGGLSARDTCARVSTDREARGALGPRPLQAPHYGRPLGRSTSLLFSLPAFAVRS